MNKNDWLCISSIEEITVIGDEILVWDGADYAIDYVDICPDSGAYYMSNGTLATHWMPLIAPTESMINIEHIKKALEDGSCDSVTFHFDDALDYILTEFNEWEFGVGYDPVSVTYNFRKFEPLQVGDIVQSVHGQGEVVKTYMEGYCLAKFGDNISTYTRNELILLESKS